MNRIFALIAVTAILACSQEHEAAVEQEITDNEELQRMYEEDQADRQSQTINWQEVAERDRARLARTYELVDSNKVRTSADFANAAMLFQHGGDTIASAMAVKMMRKAIELDSTRSKWLLAAAIDRDLMRRKKPQIYGTQFTRSGPDEPWKRYEIDTTQVTDAERIEYGVETLAQQREKVRRMNMKKLSELLDNGSSIDDIVNLIKREQDTEAKYDLSEMAINQFGYQLMAAERYEEALKIFELNTELYPEAFNTYDSLGECLLKLGREEAAKEAYEKSLELNPDNTNAERVLEEIES